VLAGRETQQLGPQVSKPWCASARLRRNGQLTVFSTVLIF
jgi:hypothetical protein